MRKSYKFALACWIRGSLYFEVISKKNKSDAFCHTFWLKIIIKWKKFTIFVALKPRIWKILTASNWCSWKRNEPASGFLSNLRLHHLPFRNGVQTPPNLILATCWRWQSFWKLISKNFWLVSIKRTTLSPKMSKVSFRKACEDIIDLIITSIL